MALFFEEDLPKGVRSKYEAVIIASRRARELQKGVKPLIDEPVGNKHTTLALQELTENRLKFKVAEIPDGM